MAATDLLWERLATAEFNIDEEDVISAQRFGWFRLYKTKHFSREAARQALLLVQTAVHVCKYEYHRTYGLCKCCRAAESRFLFPVASLQREGNGLVGKGKRLCVSSCRQRIREMQERSRRPHPFTPLQQGPFRRPGGPYHQIGGDYDRNPFFQGPTWRPFINSPGGQGGSWHFRGSGF